MKRMLKSILSLLVVALVAFNCIVQVSAAGKDEQELYDYYSSQLEKSGADELYFNLPDETRKSLNELGINSLSWEQLNQLSMGAVVLEVINLLGEGSMQPLSCMLAVLGIIIFALSPTALTHLWVSRL